MDTIKLADGSEYACGFCGQPMAHVLFIIFANMTMTEAAEICSDQDKLSKITFIAADGSKFVFKGFTVLEYMVKEPNGVRVSLREPYATEV